MILTLNAKFMTAFSHPRFCLRGAHLARKFSALLDRHFHEWHRPADYAAALHVSASHLRKLCYEHYGACPRRLINERLSREAARLLTTTALSVGEIAHRLGFDDEAYFSRFFRKHNGLPPRAYRKRRIVDLSGF